MRAILLILLLSFGANAQTRDTAQDRTQRATARTQALNAVAAEQRQTAARVSSERRMAAARVASDAIQDKAVVKDQARQDKASAQTAAQLAVAVANTTKSNNEAQDVASDITEANGVANTAAIKSVVAQSITDRQFMALLVAAMGGILFAVWLMSHRASAKLQRAADASKVAAAATHDAVDKLLVVKQATLEAVQELRALTQKLGDRTDAKLDGIDTTLSQHKPRG